MNDKSLFDEPQLNTFNEVLKFVWKYDKNILHNKALIPDMNNDFHCIKKIKKCTKVPDTIIKIMQDISIPWKSTHMSKRIKNIFGDEIQEDKINDAESIIINTIKKK